jgi:hypothetical protein
MSMIVQRMGKVNGNQVKDLLIFSPVSGKNPPWIP